MFGRARPPQSEATPFKPRSPYACAKVYAYWMVKNYREGYKMFTSNGILFNHESPRRGETFVTHKITRAVAAIFAKRQEYLYLGNLEAKRDWGFTPEYVEAMWKILQQDTPDDFVLGTGESRSVKEFVQEAFSYVSLDWQKHVKIDSRYLRPTEVDYLWGSTYAKFFFWPIPRTWWLEKPENISRVVVRYFYPEIYEKGVSMSPTIIGEAYFNFGALGVIIIMILFGVICQSLYTFLKKNRKNIGAIALYASVAPYILESFRGYFFGCTMLYLFIGLSVFLAFYFARLKTKGDLLK